MKEIELKKQLYNRFKTLNIFSGITFLTSDNVNYNDNTLFEIPKDKRFFELNFNTDTPEQVGICNNDQLERYTGFMQIDICVPLNCGEAETETKENWIYKLFKTGTTFDDVSITDVYKAQSKVELDYFRTTIRVNFDSDILNIS